MLQDWFKSFTSFAFLANLVSPIQFRYIQLTGIKQTLLGRGPERASRCRIDASVLASVAGVGTVLGHVVWVFHAVTGVLPGATSLVLVHALRVTANRA